MFGQILYTQFKWTRVALAMMSIVVFAVPAGLWRMMSEGYYRNPTPMELMNGFAALGFSFAILAFFCGFIVVAQAWQVDAVTRHVYALSLPVPWSRFVAMRFGAGAVLLAIPALAAWLGCLFVLALVEIPPTLNAYPTALAFRFLLGSLVAYSLVFAVQYVSGKKAAYLLLGAMVSFGVVAVAAEVAGREQLLTDALKWLFQFPGPLGVFGAEWMLIDV